MKKTLFLSVLIFDILLSGSCSAFFFGFGTSGGADEVIKDGQNRGIIPATPNFTLQKTYWSKLESYSDITSPQVGPAGVTSSAPTFTQLAKFGYGATCNAISVGWYFNATSVLSKQRGCIEFWYKPDYALPVGAITHIILGDNYSTGNDFCDIYLQVGINSLVRFAMRRSSSGGWIYVDENNTIWAVNDLVHIALVWNVVGFKIGETTYFQAIYINGSFKAGSTDSNFNNDWVKTYVNFGYSPDVLSYASGTIDNLKIYNYAKTDFSDRNTE